MEIAFNIAPGVSAPCLGSPEAQNYLLFLNRWNASLVSNPIQDLLLDLQRLDFFIILFQAGNISDAWRQSQTIQDNSLSAFPTDISEQAGVLKNWLAHLKDKRVSVVAQSRGGVVAALIDSCLAVNKSICFGYPFTDPSGNPEPYRIDALHHSTKPFFIFQGVRDEYGGANVQEKYKLPKNVELSFFETDHGFMDISPGEVIRIKEKALAILTEF